MLPAAFADCYPARLERRPAGRPARELSTPAAAQAAALPALWLGELLARAHDGARAYHGGCCLAPVAANALHCLLCPPLPTLRVERLSPSPFETQEKLFRPQRWSPIRSPWSSSPEEAARRAAFQARLRAAREADEEAKLTKKQRLVESSASSDDDSE